VWRNLTDCSDETIVVPVVCFAKSLVFQDYSASLLDADEDLDLADYILLFFGWGPEETGRLSSLLYLAETATAMNLEARIFLFSDGSVLAKAGITEKIDSTIAQRFRELLQDYNVKVYVCEEATRKREIGSEDLEEGISMVGYATFLGAAIEAKAVISL
jgi:predicted peroxiredoxin